MKELPVNNNEPPLGESYHSYTIPPGGVPVVEPVKVDVVPVHIVSLSAITSNASMLSVGKPAPPPVAPLGAKSPGGVGELFINGLSVVPLIPPLAFLVGAPEVIAIYPPPPPPPGPSASPITGSPLVFNI